MSLEYTLSQDVIAKRLEVAHDSNNAVIRDRFFYSEYAFFRKHIRNCNVLIAGSGLGHDSFELAQYNRHVVGIELLPQLVKESLKRRGNIKNVELKHGDFTYLSYKDKQFDAAILNMGTIGNLDDKASVIKELLRVSCKVFLDFYPGSNRGLSIRKKMYEEEKWINVKIKEKNIVSDDGLESTSMSKPELTKIIHSINGKVKYHQLNEFSVMAEIYK